VKKALSLDFLMSRRWAVEQSYLDIMKSLSTRDLDNIKFVGNNSNVSDAVITALEGKSGDEVSRGLEVREGVGIIHITGVISRYASMFDDICGGTSTQNLAKCWTTAQERADIHSVVLNFASGGGEADGIHEFSEMVFKSRGNKPITAYVGSSCCSAAYWIASSADEVVMDATARVGSIGTVISFRRSKSDENDTEIIEIISSQSPKKRLDPGTKEGRKSYQNEADQLADIFIDRIARNMHVDRETVLTEFGQGGVLVGQNAVDKGMAHRLGSYEDVISELVNQSQINSGNQEQTLMAKANNGDETSNTDNKTPSELRLPLASAVSAADFIASIKTERPDVMTALNVSLTPAPELMALDDVYSIVDLCVESNMPAMSATLLQPGVTKALALSMITSASALKDTLAASGLSASFESLVTHMQDPIKMVGLAIHDAQASADETSDSSRHIIDKKDEKEAELNANDIYKNR
jgi:ClpP class serine protease